ncbi:hypothetical protein ACFPH6_23705 [Streptomyces xiangluensis]|uniref:MT0933-like antitoxin protein n=1 Tax=Streptomyces xiangluensis TaxID=2665720 RepID=A0ABV8YQF7_9ACTN
MGLLESLKTKLAPAKGKVSHLAQQGALDPLAHKESDGTDGGVTAPPPEPPPPSAS